MPRRLVARLLHTLGLLFVVSLAGFALLRLLPGDFAEVLLMSQMDGTLPGPEAVAKFSAENGLDDPLPVQYLRWLWAVLHADMGASLVTGEPVLEDIGLRIASSSMLALAALFTALALAAPIGVLCALKPGSWFDRFFSGLAVVGMSIPNFWYALLLALLFSLALGWLPSSGHGTLAHMALPIAVIATSVCGVLARYIRGCLLDELTRPYIRTARAKGLSDAKIILFHALPNIAPGVLTLTGLQLAHVFDGMIIVETLFAWPGVGRLLVEALLNRDFPLIQACFLVIALAYIFINLAVDMAISFYDPRVQDVL